MGGFGVGPLGGVGLNGVSAGDGTGVGMTDEGVGVGTGVGKSVCDVSGAVGSGVGGSVCDVSGAVGSGVGESVGDVSVVGGSPADITDVKSFCGNCALLMRGLLKRERCQGKKKKRKATTQAILQWAKPYPTKSFCDCNCAITITSVKIRNAT